MSKKNRVQFVRDPGSNISFDKPYDIFNGFGSLKSLVIKSELFDASDTRNRAYQMHLIRVIERFKLFVIILI